MIVRYRIVAIALGLSLVRLTGCDSQAVSDVDKTIGANGPQGMRLSPEHAGQTAAPAWLLQKSP